jgi:hypothetical protein
MPSDYKDTDQLLMSDKPLNIPGRNALAYIMLPLRLAFTALFFSLMFPILTLIAYFSAIKKRLTMGLPSKILEYGHWPRHNHQGDTNFCTQGMHSQPFDQEKLRTEWFKLCGEAGIEEARAELVFHDEEPSDWPTKGSHSNWCIPSWEAGTSNFDYWPKVGNPNKYTRRLHIWNGKPGKPTVAQYAASAMPYDGSSNFNFYKELIGRYGGEAPNAIFQEPRLSPNSAAKFDRGSFAWFLILLPKNCAFSIWGFLWAIFRAMPCFGGNAPGPKVTAMNFTKEESAALYARTMDSLLTPMSWGMLMPVHSAFIFSRSVLFSGRS